MSDPIRERGAETGGRFDEGRYLYCVVAADEGAAFAADGIEDRPVSLVVEDGVGAVVQPVESVYDSDDVTEVRRWLLTHQEVVDDAGDAFGTPLPFRFDTIFTAGESGVRQWLAANHDELADALDWLAGRWEYRVEVRWNEAAAGERLRESDPELRDLADRIDDADGGTGYLLESQYEQRLAERMDERSRDLEARLVEDLDPYAVEISRAGGSGVDLSDGDAAAADTAVELSLFADEADEERIGEQLEPIADRPAFEVRYTGPWPPYSHAPEIGGEDAP